MVERMGLDPHIEKRSASNDSFHLRAGISLPIEDASFLKPRNRRGACPSMPGRHEDASFPSWAAHGEYGFKNFNNYRLRVIAALHQTMGMREEKEQDGSNENRNKRVSVRGE